MKLTLSKFGGKEPEDIGEYEFGLSLERIACFILGANDNYHVQRYCELLSENPKEVARLIDELISK